jgi:hypothetical protein
MVFQFIEPAIRVVLPLYGIFGVIKLRLYMGDLPPPHPEGFGSAECGRAPHQVHSGAPVCFLRGAERQSGRPLFGN